MLHVWCSSEEIQHNQLYQGKLHLQTNDKAESCLGASSRKKLTSKDYSRGALSPCKLDANQVLLTILYLSRTLKWYVHFHITKRYNNLQMWELHSNGTLENSYSGLCAVLNPVKGWYFQLPIPVFRTFNKNKIFFSFSY